MVSLQLKLHSCAKFRKYRVKHYGWYAVHNAFIYCTAAHSWPSEEVFCAVCFVYCLLIIMNLAALKSKAFLSKRISFKWFRQGALI